MRIIKSNVNVISGRKDFGDKQASLLGCISHICIDCVVIRCKEKEKVFANFRVHDILNARSKNYVVRKVGRKKCTAFPAGLSARNTLGSTQ